MLLKLIRIEKNEVAYLCEVWIVNPLNGDTLVGEVIIAVADMPLALIYPLNVTETDLCIRGKRCKWRWLRHRDEVMVLVYLQQIQASREALFLDICDPKPYLPGYPEKIFNAPYGIPDFIGKFYRIEPDEWD